jgi:hypothetical protein
VVSGQWSGNSHPSDVLRYSRGSKETGIGKGEYARMTRVDAPNNRLTVERKDGTEQSYDPRRQQGVSVYRERERAFSVGDRVQLTAPLPDLKLANRELGTVEGIGQQGRMSLKMDGGREVELDSVKNPHLDHGYAVTSHSSQGHDREKLGAALGHDVSHSSAHAPEMKPEQKQEQAVTPQREIAPKQEQGEDFGLGL